VGKQDEVQKQFVVAAGLDFSTAGKAALAGDLGHA